MSLSARPANQDRKLVLLVSFYSLNKGQTYDSNTCCNLLLNLSGWPCWRTDYYYHQMTEKVNKMSMISYNSLDMIMSTSIASPRKEYKAVAYDEDNDPIYHIGDLNLREARFSGAQDARSRISAALDKESRTVYPPVKIKVFEIVEELVAVANIHNETKMTRSLGTWSPA